MKSILPKTNHPWGKFLNARAEALKWCKTEFNHDNEELARTFSIDSRQVFLILEDMETKEKYDTYLNSLPTEKETP